MKPKYYNKRGGLNPNLTKENGKSMAENYPIQYKDCMNFSKHVSTYRKNKKDIDVPFSFRLQWYLDGSISYCKTCGSVCDPKNDFCSVKCSRNNEDTLKKTTETRKNKYGSYHSKNHTRNYGFVCDDGRKKAVKTRKSRDKYLDRDRVSQTMLERYGDKNYNVKRSTKTIKEKYGVDNPYQIDSVREKISRSQSSNNSFRLHLDEKVFDDHFVYEYLKANGRKKFLEEFGCSLTFLRRREIECGYREMSKSIGEIELCDFLDSLGVEYITNTRKIIRPLELDIYIPSLKVGIEFDGIYWHSAANEKSFKHQQERHILKETKCNELDIQLFRVREDQWTDRMDIWKSMIASKINRNNFKRVYARKCIIKEIDSNTSKSFVDENHIQGHSQCSKSIGLFYNDELVSVMTLGKPRFDRNYDYEIIRFCSKKFYSVVGGFSKLLKRVNGSIISYANKSWSIGGVYESSGLEYHSETFIAYSWVKNDVVINRLRLQKHKLPNLICEYDKNKTAEQNLYDNGYRKLPISGNKKYIRK